jgi:hypothetical protein
MRLITRTSFIAGAALALSAQMTFAQAQQGDVSRAVAGGGISAAGWAGQIDPNEIRAGQKLENSKLMAMGKDLHVVTGPAVTYWNASNKATGDYTVKATFTEPKFQALNSHPHPYGIVIGGNDLGTPQASYLYCAAYGNGTYIMRGFSGDTTFQLNGRRGQAHEAVKKVAVGEQVTQEIAVSVKGDKVECAINGTVVGSFPKADVVAARRLKSTDGVYGIRFGHNTEAVVKGLSVSKP